MQTISQAMTQYLAHCRYEKNLSQHSIKAYGQDLSHFASFIGNDCAADKISKDSLRDYCRELFHAELKHTSIRRKIASLKAFFKYLEFEDEIQVSPFRKMEIRIRVPNAIPRTMSLAEVKSLFLAGGKSSSGLQNKSNWIAFREAQERIVIDLLFCTGMRVSELCNMNIDDICISGGSLKVLGKGSRERTIHVMNENAQKTISEFLALRLGFEVSTRTLLVNRFRKRLQPHSVRLMLRSLSARAHLSFTVRPHMFRHTIATLLIENGVDMRFVQRLLGHSTITTTQIYTHPSTQAERQLLSAKHPRNFIL